MTIWSIPWLELALVIPLIGSIWVSLVRSPIQAYVWSLLFSGATLLCAFLAGLYVYGGFQTEVLLSVQPVIFGQQSFALDGFSAPLVPLVTLLHFLTALATGRTKMRRFSSSWTLASDGLRIALFSCTQPWLLVGLLVFKTFHGYVELLNRGKPTRVYVLHMSLFSILLVFGWAWVDVEAGHESQSAWATIPLLAAILLRCGTVPAHCWLTDWFEHASFGNALLFVAPLTGVYAAVRLVLPIAPDWVLQIIGVFSLITALYAACMATTQLEARRFFAYLFLSHASLVLLGLELHTSTSLTGAFALWISVSLALGGFGLTLRALEARFGRLALSRYHGLYDHSPALAVCFLVTGLASVGFPGTLGFIASELLVEGAIEANPFIGVVVVLTAAVNGIAVLRVYFLLFTGTKHASTISLNIGLRERIAVLTLTFLIFAGGIFPQPGLVSRHEAASEILEERAHKHPENAPVHAGPPQEERPFNVSAAISVRPGSSPSSLLTPIPAE